MSTAEEIKQKLIEEFGYPAEAILIKRPRRIFLEATRENFRKVLEYIAGPLGANHLCAITGLDEGANIAVIYHLAGDNGIVLNLRTTTPKENPVVKSVTDRFSSAENYERELADLLGVRVEGLPPGYRYPLTDDWPKGQFPLRKDWDQGALK